MYHNIVVLGVVMSILFYELTGYSPAGLIVSGYLVLYLQTPSRIVYTFVVILLTWAIAKLLSHFVILYGRRRFAAMILLSFAVNFFIQLSGIVATTPSMIGSLVPGIVAQEFERQGFLPSMLSVSIVSLLLVLAMLWFGVPVLPVMMR